MDKKIAVIAGAGGAVGSATSLHLKDAGFEVVELSRAQCDFTDAAALQEVVRHIHARYGHIDVGVYAAWPKIQRKKLADTDPKTFAAELTLSVGAAFNFFHALSPIMQTQKSGVLIGITSSVVETSSYPGAMGGYVPAKFALHGILQTLKSELEPFSVQVHEVAPGLMRAGLNKDLPERLFTFIEEKGPLQTPDDIASEITTLALGV